LEIEGFSPFVRVDECKVIAMTKHSEALNYDVKNIHKTSIYANRIILRYFCTLSLR